MSAAAAVSPDGAMTADLAAAAVMNDSRSDGGWRARGSSCIFLANAPALERSKNRIQYCIRSVRGAAYFLCSEGEEGRYSSRFSMRQRWHVPCEHHRQGFTER